MVMQIFYPPVEVEVVWLCNYVYDKQSNIFAVFHPFEPKKFLRPFGQEECLKKFFSWPRASWARVQKQRFGKLSQSLDKVLVWRAETHYANLFVASFCIKLTQNYYFLNLKWSKKIDWPIFGFSAAIGLTKTARHMGAWLHEMAIFFIK